MLLSLFEVVWNLNDFIHLILKRRKQVKFQVFCVVCRVVSSIMWKEFCSGTCELMYCLDVIYFQSHNVVSAVVSMYRAFF